MGSGTDFVFGHNLDGDEFIVHCQRPRFMARVVDLNDKGLPRPPDEDADTISGIRFSNANYPFVLCELVSDHLFANVRSVASMPKASSSVCRTRQRTHPYHPVRCLWNQPDRLCPH